MSTALNTTNKFCPNKRHIIISSILIMKMCAINFVM